MPPYIQNCTLNYNKQKWKNQQKNKTKVLRK